MSLTGFIRSFLQLEVLAPAVIGAISLIAVMSNKRKESTTTNLRHYAEYLILEMGLTFSSPLIRIVD